MEELFKARKEKLNLFKSIRNKMQDKKRIDQMYKKGWR